MWTALFLPFSSHRVQHRRDLTPHNHDCPGAGFWSIRSGKTCELRYGIGTTVYDAWTFAWAPSGLRGAPLHLSTPFRRSIISLPSLCVFSILLKGSENRAVVTRHRLGKTERMLSDVVGPKQELGAVSTRAIQAQTLRRCVFIHPVHQHPLQVLRRNRSSASACAFTVQMCTAIS
jgi:hypothetical protein